MTKPDPPAPGGADGELAGPGSGITARSAIRERVGLIVSPTIKAKSVVLAGAGSGGSQTAEALVRSGVEHLTVIDPDAVEPPNISRAVYSMRDIGQPKVAALHRRLREINPQVTGQFLPVKLQDIPAGDLDQMISSADLAIGATDDPAAQRMLNHFAYGRGVPAVFAGVYARGHGGEVIFTVPGITCCYHCATAVRHRTEIGQRQTDYGNGRLAAEPALGTDILHIVTASVKIALSLLEVTEEGEDVPLRDFMLGALERGYSYLIISTVPGYGFFPQVFGRVAGQYAYQSAWLICAREAGCPVCGERPADPASVQHGGVPDVTKLTVHDQ